MDNDLNRSVRLLEDAVSAPSRGLFRQSISKGQSTKNQGKVGLFKLVLAEKNCA